MAKEEKKEIIKSPKRNTTRKTTKTNEEKMVDIKVVEKDIQDKLKKIKKSENIEIKNNDSNSLHFSLFEVILLVIITILFCILVGYFLKPAISQTSSDNIELSDKNLQKFLKEYQYILDNYYGDVNKNQLIEDAIKGMFISLDDYSSIIDQESNSFNITLNGEYEGVGIVIVNDTLGNIIIQSVYEGTPADKAGIKAGDIVTKFNDTSLDGVSTSKLVEMIASANNMELTILRNNQESVVTLKKERIILDSISYKMLDNKIGYIFVDVFAANTASQFIEAVNDLEKQGMKSLIIDLRDNTGGHLTAVEEMLSSLVSKKHIIYQLEDKAGTEKIYSKGEKDKTYKIVVLQNSISASASEIMASSLKENLNAYIIGNTSFGKGTVQTLKEISDSLQYKVTTKRWLTPNGNWINGTGVTPNLEISLSDTYYQNPTFDNDDQLKAAINYLK